MVDGQFLLLTARQFDCTDWIQDRIRGGDSQGPSDPEDS